MKTIVIVDSCGQDPIRYAVFDVDLSHLHNVYIGLVDTDPDAEDEAVKLLTCIENNSMWEANFPIEAARHPNSKVIVIGVIP